MKYFFDFVKNNTVKRICIVLILLFLFVLVSAISYVDAISTDISNNVFRLHVIANSDSVEDQNLQYLVRDKLIEYHLEFFKAGISAVIKKWLYNGCVESPEEITNVIITEYMNK